MDRSIARRDVLHVIVLGTTAAACAPLLAAQTDAAGAAQIGAQDAPSYYPPLLTGMRGSHPGSFEAPHGFVAGLRAGAATNTQEEYDLIVVDGGISGLAAAHFYCAQSVSRSRVLILDNHDDFGGHAKRNEFRFGDALALVNGGTLQIDSPRPFSAIAGGLLKTLGIDVKALAKRIQHRDFTHAWLPELQQPHVIGVHGSDESSSRTRTPARAAYIDSAINQAHRALAELLRY